MVGVMGIPTGRPMLRHAYTLISIPMSSFAMALRGGYDYMKVPPREATHTSGNVIFTFFCDERKRTQRAMFDFVAWGMAASTCTCIHLVCPRAVVTRRTTQRADMRSVFCEKEVHVQMMNALHLQSDWCSGCCAARGVL